MGLAYAASWTLLFGIFAVAIYQGADFARTKETATVWGCVIGLAAALAWLAVDAECCADDEEHQSTTDSGESGEKKVQ